MIIKPRSLKETVRVEVSGAFPEALLNACAANAIEFWDMECVDAYTIILNVYEERINELEAEAARCMCDIKRIKTAGGKSTIKLMLRRKWLVIFAFFAAGILALSSLYIWDFNIYGNNKISSGKILRALEECGVSYGCYWPKLSSDLVRSQMVELLPELAWMSINVSGSRADILIVEREEKPEIYAQSAAADIVAKKNGIISKLSVFNGKPLVTVGQAVLRDETLVSGEMDSITADNRFVRALARTEADTWYEICSVCPAESAEKTEVRKRSNYFALKIGNTRLNFYIRGRKAVDGCDKIIHNYKLGLEGQFTLPLTLIREEYIYNTTRSGRSFDEEGMFARMYATLADSVDGTVLEHSFSSAESAGVIYATMRAHCLENIALTKEIQP